MRATADDFRYSGACRSGGLMSYGPNVLDLYRRVADFVDKVLRGRELVFNLTTAMVLGIEIPPMLLARADEVIE